MKLWAGVIHGSEEIGSTNVREARVAKNIDGAKCVWQIGWVARKGGLGQEIGDAQKIRDARQICGAR